MIRLDNVTKSFGTLPVLRGVSFAVERGEVAMLIGGSGSGKSTALRCINALETFDSGQIHVADISLSARQNGDDLAETHRRLRRRVGMVFQQFNLFPHMSVMQNVMAGPLFVEGWPREKAAALALELLDRVGMAAKADARPAQLSGGQQQRVAIARTLATMPDAILFDEPTSALDPKMTNEVLSVIADLASGGQTMIVVSHAMGFVRKCATRVHVLSSGAIIESGPPQQIFESPSRTETREFLTHALA